MAVVDLVSHVHEYLQGTHRSGRIRTSSRLNFASCSRNLSLRIFSALQAQSTLVHCLRALLFAAKPIAISAVINFSSFKASQKSSWTSSIISVVLSLVSCGGSLRVILFRISSTTLSSRFKVARSFGASLIESRRSHLPFVRTDWTS